MKNFNEKQMKLTVEIISQILHDDEYSDVIIPSISYREDVEDAPRWNIQSFEFFPTSQIANIIFLQTRAHKINNGKNKAMTYKVTHQTIPYTIHLSNSVLEGLENNEDPIIQAFAEAIIHKIQNSQFWPSWYCKKFLSRLLLYYQEQISSMENVRRSQLQNTIEENEKIIQSNKMKMNGLQLAIFEHRPYVEKYEKAINKIK